MIKSIYFICLSNLVLHLHAIPGVSFIEPCKWDDKECLIKSAQKALPHFADGIPEIKTSPLDPLEIEKLTINEGGLHIVLKDIEIERLRECHVIDVERNIHEQWLSIALECPIEIHGEYSANGKLLHVEVDGDGSFHIKSEKIAIAIKMDLKTVNNHWRTTNYVYKFEFQEKAIVHFENLCKGDEKKAAPVKEILDKKWKEIINTIGKPIIGEVVDRVYIEFKKFTDAVPADELELSSIHRS